MEIDILIDELTACLIQRETGLIVETDYEERSHQLNPKTIMGGNLIGQYQKTMIIKYMSCLLRVMIQFKVELLLR